MYRILFILISILITVPTLAQRLEVEERKQKLPDGTYTGYLLIIDGDLEGIEEEWNASLKEVGKVKKKRGHWEITEAEFKNQADLTLGTVVKLRTDSAVSIWFGAKLKKESKDINNDVEDYLTDFGHEHYRNILREDVEETEDAAIFLSRQHQKLLNDNKNLSYELEEAMREQERLSAALEKINLEIDVIRQKMENNTLEADRMLGELEKTNQRLEGKKSQLKKMN